MRRLPNLPSVRRDIFRGAIAGLGSASGVRVVVGRWQESPLGAFADVMLAEPDGTRWLLAPTPEVAEYVASTYRFDRVEVGSVSVAVQRREPWTWTVSAPGLEVSFEVGPRTWLGHLLRVVPQRVAVSPTFTLVTDPVARTLLRGVRTRGTAQRGRRAHSGATDLHPIVSSAGTWRGGDLGGLAPVAPDPGFGFGSTPARPSVTSVTTTIIHV